MHPRQPRGGHELPNTFPPDHEDEQGQVIGEEDAAEEARAREEKRRKLAEESRRRREEREAEEERARRKRLGLPEPPAKASGNEWIFVYGGSCEYIKFVTLPRTD